MHTIATTVVLCVVALYVALHFNLAGMAVEHVITEALAEKLETRVTLDSDVEVDWLNQVVLNHLTIYDQHDDTLLYARRVLVAYDMLPLLQHHMVMNTCQLIDFDIRASKDSLAGKYNFQFIIDALAKKDSTNQQFIEQVDLNAIMLRMGQLSYHVKNQPHSTSNRLDKNHIVIKDFNANLHLHDMHLQAKKMHFVVNQARVKATRFDMAFHPRQAMQKGDALVFSIHGLELDDPTLRFNADIEGQGRALNLSLHQLSIPGRLGAKPYLQDLALRADIHIEDILAPIDSLCFKALIHQATAEVSQLGTSQLTASIDGTPSASQIECSLSSDLGEARLSGDLTSDIRQGNYKMKGHCQSTGIDMESLFPSAEVGLVALNMNFDVSKHQHLPLQLALDGDINRLDFRHHTYRDILLNGEVAGDAMKGKIQLNDSLGNVDMQFDLNLAADQTRYKLEGDLKHIQPYALNLTKLENLDSIAFNGHVKADILAPRWNKAEGMLHITKFSLQRGHEHLKLEPLYIEGTSARGALSCQALHMEYQHNRHDQSYHLEGRLPVANDLYALFRLPFRATNMTRFEADFDYDNQLRKAWIDMPAIVTDNKQEIAAVAEVHRDDDNQLLPVIDLLVKNSNHNIKGQFTGKVNLSPLEVTLQPTTILYNNEELQLTSAHMKHLADGNYAFENFSLQGTDQRFSASGIVGNNGNNDMVIQLENFNLGQIFSNFNKGYLKFDGKATGDLLVSSEPQLNIKAQNLVVEDFTYIDTLVGDARLDLEFLIPSKRLNLNCDIITDKQYTTHAGGSIKLGSHDTLDLYFDADHLPIGFINYWAGDILQQFSGRGTGKIRLFGDAKALQLIGDPVVDGSFTHNIVGAHFHLNDVVHLEENLLSLNNVLVDDHHGHNLQLNANITHHNLRNFGYDVNIDIPTNEQGFLVLDREQVPGRIYWGQLYVSGQANLKGGDGHHRFNLNLTTTDKSWFYLSPFEQDFASEGSNEYSFLTFRDKAEITAAEEEKNVDTIIKQISAPNVKEEENKTDIQVDMQVHATDQCQLYVQLDPLAEDKLICRGNGDLAVHYDPRRDITLAGIYHISSGSYGMSMKGDLMNKVFQLQNTSTVHFSGVPSEAELMLDARYSIPSVNLMDLDESITTLGSLSRSTVPVDCMLAVTGTLSSPQVSFDLELKNVSDEIQTYVHNVIGTQEMLNQEVLYLLLFSKFYTPQYAQSTQNHNGSEITSFASASITSQLNQLLGNVSNNFTMGTNFRTDRGDFSDMEMDVSLSTRLLGDRLLLNGNVGYRDPANRLGGATNNNNSFIGDFELEFLINNSGTMRAKAYSHYNERDYSINNALTTQGISFIIRHDFQSFHDLWRRKK